MRRIGCPYHSINEEKVNPNAEGLEHSAQYAWISMPSKEDPNYLLIKERLKSLFVHRDNNGEGESIPSKITIPVINRE